MLIRDYPATNAIKVGRLFLKPADVYPTITQCCRMLLHEAADRTLPLGRAGSATLIRYGNVNYAIATRHQLDIRPGEAPPKDVLETIRISSGSGRLANIPLQRCVYEILNPEQEYHDILIFEVASTWRTQAADSPFFYPLRGFSHAKRVKSFLVGYPSIDGVMNDYLEAFTSGEEGEIHLKRAIADCDLDLTHTSAAEHVRRYLHTKHRPLMDGYSGGAIFSLIGNLGNLEIVLDGIVVRGGAQHIHIVDADYLARMVSANQNAEGLQTA